jgi:hypothetical protein
MVVFSEEVDVADVIGAELLISLLELSELNEIKVPLGILFFLLITIRKELLLQVKIVALLTIWHIRYAGRNIFQK